MHPKLYNTRQILSEIRDRRAGRQLPDTAGSKAADYADRLDTHRNEPAFGRFRFQRRPPFQPGHEVRLRPAGFFQPGIHPFTDINARLREKWRLAALPAVLHAGAADLLRAVRHRQMQLRGKARARFGFLIAVPSGSQHDANDVFSAAQIRQQIIDNIIDAPAVICPRRTQALIAYLPAVQIDLMVTKSAEKQLCPRRKRVQPELLAEHRCCCTWQDKAGA